MTHPSDDPFGGFDDGAVSGAGCGVSGGAESGLPWGTIVIGLLIILVLLVIWRFSDLHQNRVCISTDLADYWPDHISGVPRLPGQDYLPALSDFLPAENVVAARNPREVDDNLLSSVLVGN